MAEFVFPPSSVVSLTILTRQVVIDMCMLISIEAQVYIGINNKLELFKTWSGGIECLGRSRAELAKHGMISLEWPIGLCVLRGRG